MTQKIPRLVMSAPHGRSGKTTITLGLLSALKQQNYKVQAFKKGPDFIDPSWISLVSGTSCRNLDCFFMEKETIRHSVATYGKKSDITIVEGAMGLFDGVDLEGSGSTAEIAKIIDAPIILVVDTTRMTRSVAPLINGFLNFDSEIKIAGVILNKVARLRHESILRKSIEKYCDVPVLGVFPKGGGMVIPDRHLGLIPAGEREDVRKALEEIGKQSVKCLDLEAILKVAFSAKEMEDAGQDLIPVSKIDNEKVTIGVCKDTVFSFYYPENLEALEKAGAKLCFIDTLKDNDLPTLDALYIGGGFPEVFAQQLEQNFALRKAIKEIAKKGLPIYAECAGLIYLGKTLSWKGKTYNMSGVLPLEVQMNDKPQGHGYEIIRTVHENPFFTKGTIIKGHEFHNSKVVKIDEQEAKLIFQVDRGSGVDGKRDGVMRFQTLATYTHVHALATPIWATSFVELAYKYKQNKSN